MDKRQQYDNVRLVVHSANGTHIKHGVNYGGQGMLIDDGMLDEQESFHFVIDTPRRGYSKNRIVFQGDMAIVRQLKNGNYSIRFIIQPTAGIVVKLPVAKQELGVAFHRILCDHYEQEGNHEI